MKKLSKKLIALLLTLVMLLSVAPLGAFATGEEPVQYAFDGDDLNKLITFPVARYDLDYVTPLCSFTAPADGTYFISVFTPKGYSDPSSYYTSLDVYDYSFPEEGITLQAGETVKFKAQAGGDYEVKTTRIKIQEMVCIDNDNNNICDFCGAFCSDKTENDNLPLLGEIPLGEVVNVTPKFDFRNEYSAVYAKFSFTPPEEGEYCLCDPADNYSVYLDEATTDEIYPTYGENADYKKYALEGGHTHYILVQIPWNDDDLSQEICFVKNCLYFGKCCSDLNHNGYCDADGEFLGVPIIPGECIDVYMDSAPTTSFAVFTPEEDGLYRFTTSYIAGGSFDPINNVDFSLYENDKVYPDEEYDTGSEAIAKSTPYTVPEPEGQWGVTFDNGHMLAHKLEAGKTYILRMHRENASPLGRSNFEIKLEKLHSCVDANADGVCDECNSVIEVELTLNHTKTVTYPEVNVGNPVYLKFTPNRSGTYYLAPTPADAMEISLYASDKTTELDMGGYGYNYVCNLEAGQTYYFKTNYRSYDGVGNADYTLTCAHSIKTTVPAVTQATCLTPAYTEHQVCDTCGEKFNYEVTVPQLEHSFTNYISNNDGTETATCDNGCGETDTRTSFSASYSVSLNLARSIDFNLIIKNANVSDADLKSKLQIGYENEYLPFTVENGKVTAAVSKEAKDIDEIIKLWVFYDGNRVKSVAYTVEQYCNKVIELYQDTDMAVLCEALKLYGLYAEYYFDQPGEFAMNHTFDSPITAQSYQDCWDKLTLYNRIEETELKVSVGGAYSKVGASLSLGSTTTMKLIIKTPDLIDKTKEDFVIINNLGEVVHPDLIGLSDPIKVTDPDDGVEYFQYTLTVNNITANTLSRRYTITINGVSESDFKVEFGPDNYLSDMFNSNNPVQPNKKCMLAFAIYWYGEAAAAVSAAQ